jgi:hypothetical protein
MAVVIVTRHNPDRTVKEVKRYPSTKKGKAAMAEDSKTHTEEFKAGKVDFRTGLWSC